MLCCTVLYTARLDKYCQNNSSTKRISSETNMTRRFVTLFVVVFFIRKDATGVITNGPSNAVVEVGGLAIFNCTSSIALQNWIFAKTRDDIGNSSAQNIALSCVIQTGFDTHYAVDRPGGSTNTCNLIVKATTMQQAGTYTCTDSAPGPSAILTVIDPIPVITSNSTIDAVEGESVMFECELNYNGTTEPTPTLRPYFYWTNSNGQNVTSFSDSTTENKAVSQLAVTAGRQNMTAYTCRVYFILNPSTTSNYASNIPTVNSSATSSTIEVLYYPAITSITSTVSTSDNCVYKQEILTCTADANPPAQYEWLDLSNNALTSGATKSISTGGRYQCISFNDIRSQRYNDSKIENLTTCVSPTNVTISGLGCVNNSCTCMNHTLKWLTLTCMANGYPAPTYQWWSNVPEEVDLGNNQTIMVTTDGNYSCTASNKYGNQIRDDRVYIRVSDCKPHPTTTPSTPATKTAVITTKASSPSISPTTTTGSNPTAGPHTDSLSAGAAVGIAIGCIIIIVNVIAIGLFIRYYGKVPESETNARDGNANSKSNKSRLNRRFPWLQKMLPCLNDTEQEAGSNIPWVLLFAFLGTITGVVTFPVWICLANKSEKTNERSSLTTRENGGAEGESVANGMRLTNYPPPDYPPDSPPFKNRKGGQQQNDPYQNSSMVNIELANSRHLGNRITDPPRLNTSPAWKPTPPDKKFVSGPAEKYVIPDPVKTDPGQSPLYADLPLKLDQNQLKPEQLLVDSENTNAPEPENNYAPLKII